MKLKLNKLKYILNYYVKILFIKLLYQVIIYGIKMINDINVIAQYLNIL